MLEKIKAYFAENVPEESIPAAVEVTEVFDAVERNVKLSFEDDSVSAWHLYFSLSGEIVDAYCFDRIL